MDTTQKAKASWNKELQPLEFSQTARGEHFIRQGNQEIQIDVNALSLAEIRTLLNGIANIQSSLCATFWDKELVKKG